MARKQPERRVRSATLKSIAQAAWEVKWHPKAVAEKDALEKGDREAIHHVIEKLEIDGVTLPDPHQRAVMQSAGEGLRELRPRAGRSRWRPLYRQVGERLFAILAIAPESETDAGGYDHAVKRAQGRRKAIEKVLSKKSAGAKTSKKPAVAKPSKKTKRGKR